MRASPDLWAFLAITGAVLLANILYVTGIFDANPLGRASGLGIVTHAGLLGGLPTIDPDNGVTSQALGHLAVHDWFHLSAPWWNPFQGTGAPLAGEMQSGALSPFTIFTGASNGQLYEHILFELVSGFATYLLLRRLAIARWASTAAAVAFALNGTFAWFAHAPVNVVPFLPLLLLGIELAFAASVGGRRGGWWLIAVAGALSAYGGFPEAAYIDGLFAVLWIVWRCGCAGRPYIRSFALKIVLAAVCGVLLALPILVPFADYVPLSLNAHSAIGNARLPKLALPQLLFPYVYGPIFGFSDSAGTVDAIWGSVGGYLSTSLLFFGLVGLVSSGRRGLRLILVLWIVLTLPRIYGEPPGLGGVLGVFPDMIHVAFDRYADPALELAVVILAALGMDSLSAGTVRRARLFAVSFLSLLVLVVAAIAAHSLAVKLLPAGHQVYSRGSVIWGVAILAAAVLAAVVPNPRARRLIIAAIVCVDALVLFALPELSAPRKVVVDSAPVAFLQRHQGLSRFFTLGSLQPDYGSYFGLRELNANDALLPSVFTNYVNKRLDPTVLPLIFNGTPAGRAPGAPTAEQELLSNLNGYRAAAVKYVLTPVGLALPRKSFRLVLQSPTIWVYQLSGASSYFTSTHPACRVGFRSDSSARVSCATATTLVRRETYMPGWTASVDGKSQPIRHYDGAFQAVSLGPGDHRVTFRFRPPHLTAALLGFVAGCLWLVVAPLPRRIRIQFRRS